MRSICFYFQVHQPFRLRTYRFFDIGSNHDYFDNYRNKYILRRVADKCYLPMNQLLYELIKEYGSGFKVSFSISGTALDQFEMFTPDVIESYQRLAQTGCVEFLAETYSHSLSSLKSKNEFFHQVNEQKNKIKQLFGQDPVTYRNTELIYSNGIGEMVAELGFKTMLTEGAKHILGWKSPNYLYCNAINPKLKLLLKNFQLSDDIAFRFSLQSWSAWPLTAEKYVDWLNAINPAEETVNLFMDYETFGEHQWKETGIFDFMRALPGQVFSKTNFGFRTPNEVSDILQPVAAIHVPFPISWADEERDLTAWLGNELQDDAFNRLYDFEEKVKACSDENVLRDWKYLQTSDHFYYMCTKWFSDGDVHKYFNPYNSPYEAYVNFMNILSDFIMRVDNIATGNYIEKIDKEPVIKTNKAKLSKKKPSIKLTKKSSAKKYEFDDIFKLNKSQIKKILKNTDIITLKTALSGIPKKTENVVIFNLGFRTLKEYNALVMPEGIKQSKILSCRKSIIEMIKKVKK